MKADKTKKKMTLAALTIPIFIEQLLSMLMGNADTLMLSQYSDNSVAAVGVANQIIFMVIVMFGFIATGTVILNAQALGAKNYKLANSISVVSIFANLCIGIFISLALWLFGEQILGLMNIEEEVFEESYDYLSIVGGFLFLQALIMTIGAILRSYGFTKDAMYITIGMNLLNIIGNYLFIFGPFGIPVLGVTGVAFSTMFSRIVGLIIITIILFKRVEEPLPFAKIFKLPLSHLKDILRIGLPSAGEHLSYNLAQFVILYFITMIGTEAITTRIYTQNIMMLIFLSSLAIAQGTQILIGHYIGAKEYDNVYRRCLNSIKIGVIMSFCVAILFSFFADSLLGIFTDNPKIIEVGSTLLMMTILLEPGRAVNMIGINSLRATSDVKFPLVIAIISMWGIGIPVAYVFGIGFEFGLIGIWMSFIADEWVRAFLVLRRWVKKKWMERYTMRV